MGKVADPLREYADNLANGRVADYEPSVIAQFIYAHAEEIDREHERRMEQQSHDLRKAFCRYIGGVLDDYKHGIKRKRLRK